MSNKHEPNPDTVEAMLEAAREAILERDYAKLNAILDQPRPGIEARQAEDPCIGIKPDGTPNVLTWEEYRIRAPLVRKALQTGDPDDLRAAGIRTRGLTDPLPDDEPPSAA
jgi:hypothetical protein